EGNEQRELPTILVYTAGKQGAVLAEASVIGLISDISGSEKFIVVRDEMNDTCFAYRVVASRDTLDAVAILPYAPKDYEARLRVTIAGEIFKLAPSDDAMGLIRNKRRWIQDAGCALGVLIEVAAQRRPIFTNRRIDRPRLAVIPDNVPIHTLAEQRRFLEEQAVQTQPAEDTSADGQDAMEKLP